LPSSPAGASARLERADYVDAITALCKALERAEFKPQPGELLGWL
jgi:hypothetical protein